MPLTGLVVSQSGFKDTSAYTYRVKSLAECLEKRSIRCDFLYMHDTRIFRKWTTASLFMTLKIGDLRKYDFIYAGCEGAGQALLLSRPFLKGPIIYDMHGDALAQSALEQELKTGGRTKVPPLRARIFSQAALAAADQLITVSRPHVQWLLRQGVPEDRVRLIRNGVDLALFRKLPFPEKPQFHFGYAGGFQYWQGLDNFIQAFEKILNPKIRLLMVGFSEQIKKRLRDRVSLVDHTDRIALIELLKSVSIMVVSGIPHRGILHAFHTKFAEYAALGKPILANKVNETADFIRAYEAGFVVDSNPAKMARMMEEAADLPIAVLSEMGNRARIMAEENFSWDKIGDEYAALVEYVVSRFRKDRKRPTVDFLTGFGGLRGRAYNDNKPI
jgi:glycosyltransferase involved in cell wall biosynthesis